MSGPVRVKVLTTRLVDALVGMRAKVIALRLQQVGGQPCRAITIEECERRGKRGCGNSQPDSMNNRFSPRGLIAVEGFGKKSSSSKFSRPRVLIEGFFDFAQESAADDASSAPHQRNSAHVEVPAVLLGRRSQQHVTLRVGNNLGTIERVANALNVSDAVAVNSL